MNVIEQTVKAQNGAIDLHIPVPESLDGYTFKAVVVYEKTEEPEQKPKLDLSSLVGKYSYLSQAEKDSMQKELADIHNEWERSI